MENKEIKNMIIDNLNLEIRIIKIEDNLITLSFQSDSKLKLLIKDIKAIDDNDKIIESDCFNHGVISVVLNNSQTKKTFEFKSEINDCKKISLVIKDRKTSKSYPIKLNID